MDNASTREASAGTGQTFFYFGWLTLFVYLATPTGYLVDIQTSYMLKNQLHATATQISTFRLLTAIPVYFAFVFGLTRDLWNPFGLRDRGFFLIFASSNRSCIYMDGLVQRLVPGAAHRDVTGDAVVAVHRAAYQGLIALVGQEKLMSGRLSVLWNVVSSVPYIAGAFASGYISEHLPPKETFVLVAVSLCYLSASCGLWKPRSVFSHTYDKPQARGTNFVGDVKRLVKHRAIYPAVLICFLWNFAPGAATPLQFYLTNELHASDAIYSYYNGIFVASFIPTFLLYGVSLQESSAEQAAVVGNDYRRAADDSAGVHSHRQPCAAIGGADRVDGWHRHGGVFRSRDEILSARPAGNFDDDGGRRFRALGDVAATFWVQKSTTAARRMDSSTV